MLTIEQCRQILGEAAHGMSDKDIEAMRDTLHAFALLLIDDFLIERVAMKICDSK